jgi:hypothetical protein
MGTSSSTQLFAREPNNPCTSCLDLIRGEVLVRDWTVFDLLFALNPIIIGTVAWLSSHALPTLVGPGISNPIHIARDLIDHQYSPRRASVLTVACRLSRDSSNWPRRARIQARLSTLIDDLLGDGKFDQVIFAAHSQQLLRSTISMTWHQATRNSVD